MKASVNNWTKWYEGMIEIHVDREMLGIILDHVKSDIEHNVQNEQYYEAKDSINRYIVLKDKYDGKEYDGD